MSKKGQKYSKEWLSQDEIETLFSNPEINYRDLTLMRLCYYGALRISEALNAISEDFRNEEYPFLLLRTQKTDKKSWEVQPIPLHTYSEIKRYCKNNNIKTQNRVFQSRQNDWLGYDRALQIVKECAKKVGIVKKITTHTFRRSRLQHFFQKGKDPYFCQDFARHKSIDTTRKYMKIEKSNIFKQMEEIDRKEKTTVI